MVSWSAIIAVVVLLACGVEREQSGPKAISTPVSVQNQLNLSDKSVHRLTVQAKVGDRIDVVVDIRQQGDEYARCGQPTVRDVFGNVLAILSPKTETPGVGASYQYAFFAASNGQYTLELNNRECNVRETPAEATVTWTVHSP